MIEFYRTLARTYSELSFAVKAAIVVGLAVGATAIGVAIVVWLPADHFSEASAAKAPRQHPVLRWTLIILKNALGVIVLPLGVVMALPLVPGPGLVFILVGLSLLDFPGKRRMERKLLAVESVRRFLNDVREKFGKPPLIVDPDPK